MTNVESKQRSSAETADTVVRLHASARWRCYNGWIVSFVVVVVAAGFLIAVSDLLVVAVRNTPAYIRGLIAWNRGEIPWNEYLLVASRGNTIEVFVLTYVALYLLPFVFALPVAAPVLAFWRRPPRFLFLRPFNRAPLTRGLSRLVRRDAARYGHTYTLADADLRVRWWVRVPLLLGQLSLLSFRTRKIRQPRQLARLVRVLERTWLRNINWCLSWNKVFPVASDDTCWKAVVERLLERSAVVFIDLTGFRTNVLWEIALIRERGLEHRVIYLLERDAVGVDTSAITTHLKYSPQPDRLHFYHRHGAVDRQAFRASLARTIASADHTPALPSRVELLHALAVALFSVGCLLILVVALFPALHERVQRAEAPLQLGILAYGVVTWILLWVTTYWSRSMVFLAIVQTLLVLAFVLTS